VVERLFELKNQHGKVVQTGHIDILVRTSPAGAAAAGTD
jgi:hypothetical protein